GRPLDRWNRDLIFCYVDITFCSGRLQTTRRRRGDIMRTDVAAPVLDAPTTLRFQGDWGQANLTKVCNWIGQEFVDRAPAGSRSVVWDGRGGADAIEALRGGAVDIAMMTPARFANMAIDGKGGFDPFPELCSL